MIKYAFDKLVHLKLTVIISLLNHNYVNSKVTLFFVKRLTLFELKTPFKDKDMPIENGFQFQKYALCLILTVKT